MKFTQKQIKRNILLTPGPVTTTDSVKLAQAVSDICPREKEFGLLMKSVADGLTKLAGPLKEYTTVLFGGSGTAAVEAMLCSLNRDKNIFIIVNGSYSQRMCDILDAYGVKHIIFKSGNTVSLDYKKLEDALLKSKAGYLCVVHNETGTGLLNDIGKIGRLCKKYKVQLAVDAMSTFGALDIDMKKMNISFLAASSNKNIQGMPGLSFVVCSKKALASLKKNTPRSFYLDLKAQHGFFEKTKQTRFTPPVQTIYALKQAILELNAEGVANRRKRYTKSWQTLVEGLSKLGLKLLIENQADQSKIITAVYEPNFKGYKFEKMHDYLIKKGFTIYPGKVDGTKTFRIGNIGDIDDKDIKNFLKELQIYLKKEAK